MTPQEVADAIAQMPHVEMTRYYRSSRRILVQYPRSRGGRIYLTIPEARKALARAEETNA